MAAGVFAQTPQISFPTPSIAKVRWQANQRAAEPLPTGVCIYDASAAAPYTTFWRGDTLCMATAELRVEILPGAGALRFVDPADGRVLLREDAAEPRQARSRANTRVTYDDATARQQMTANGAVVVKDTLRVDTTGVSTVCRVKFRPAASEGIYGLGAHIEGYMNLNGRRLHLTQHNLKATVPMLLSTAGYGLLLDAGCAMVWDGGEVEFDDTDFVDYYFIKGSDFDTVVGGYRWLTGAVPMLPRYALGYIQSRERYRSSDEIVSTVREYRRRGVGLDMIVQDWNYWPQGWGYMKMDPRFYPDPKALADSVHALGCRLMVSIWPNPQYCPEQEEFAAKGLMLEHSIYDAFSAAGRDLYWKWAYGEFFSRGFDAWWCDSSEPLDGDWNQPPGSNPDGTPYSRDNHERRYLLNKAVLSEALGPQRSNLFSLYHSMGIYEHQRAVSDAKRVVNLTRSAYAGQQRYATVVWNGDTYASWESFRRQIPSGLNYMATGCPWWSMDAGCFFTGSSGRWFQKGEFPRGVADAAYREFYVRMLQWASMLPVMRSHGTDTPREIWQFGSEGTVHYDAIADAIGLRYRLLPYLYSLAAMQTRQDYTMARMLAFDFAADPNVLDIADQYMLGRILVNPVTEPGAVSRRVYLPAQSEWIDFHNPSCRYAGGRWIEADAPLCRMPLFVRAGSIIVTAAGEHRQADTQINAPLQVTVYDGADAHFDFYEDAGDGYAYERGECAIVPMRWDDRRRTLTLDARQGAFEGMAKSRSITVNLAGGKSTTLTYSGRRVKVRL